MQPFAWEDLKRSLHSRQIQIESVAERLSLVSTVSLEPEPIPLSVKVVLVGEPVLYYLLSAMDPGFSEHFKVPVDFDDTMAWDDDNAQMYARMLATFVEEDSLKPLDTSAVARLVEHASRLTGDTTKLTAQLSRLQDLTRESSFWTEEAGREVVSAEDVDRAIEAQVRRADRMRERVQEGIERGQILIATRGERVGQVNGLSVIELGGFAFGKPSRITARVRVGKGELLDIEREVELGGPIHSKGVLILAGYLGQRFAKEHPLSLSASLVFEQSYGGVEGDSASSAELYTLLSALADAPIRQSLAVTGSVNQHGEIQAVGGVNEKIEGFFDVCKTAGLDGTHGVLIPASNTNNLMLRRDVVEAAGAGRFHVYAVSTVDEGIELLTGIAAGEADADGVFPEGSINRRVADKLLALATTAHTFGNTDKDGDEEEGS
jgi:predicted ATP-dependent protease